VSTGDPVQAGDPVTGRPRGYRSAMSSQSTATSTVGTDTGPRTRAADSGAVTETATLAGAIDLDPATYSGTDVRRVDGPLRWPVDRNPSPAGDAERAALMVDPGFGRHFTDNMATAVWTADAGWHDSRIAAFGPFQLSPASAVLHYGQSIFEGLKAYRHADGSVHLFRPEANAERFARSAHRLALPTLPVEDFVASLVELVRAEIDWVPTGGGETSLYLRPMMFGSEAFLGVRPSVVAQYSVMASPAGAYFARGPVPVSLWVSEHYTRAAPGGTGAAKTGGNYAASLLPQQEAVANGCDQVLFLDAVQRRWIEELGGMNVFAVRSDGTVVTPPISGTILEGVTRDAILAFAGDLGHEAVQAPIDLAELRADLGAGRVTELFACGTAAVVTPVGRIVQAGHEDLVVATDTGPVTAAIRSALLDLQYGRRPDTAGWLRRVV